MCPDVSIVFWHIFSKYMCPDFSKVYWHIFCNYMCPDVSIVCWHIFCNYMCPDFSIVFWHIFCNYMCPEHLHISHRVGVSIYLGPASINTISVKCRAARHPRGDFSGTQWTTQEGTRSAQKSCQKLQWADFLLTVAFGSFIGSLRVSLGTSIGPPKGRYVYIYIYLFTHIANILVFLWWGGASRATPVKQSQNKTNQTKSDLTTRWDVQSNVFLSSLLQYWLYKRGELESRGNGVSHCGMD
jgi:hypothetical protein